VVLELRRRRPPSAKEIRTVDTPKTSLVARKVRVLLVDDEALVLRILERELTRGGFQYEVRVATDVATALEVLEREPIDAIVSDVQMPGGSGCDLHREVAARHPGLEHAIVFLTGGCSEENRRYLRETGNEVLLKPVPIARLQDAIGAAMRDRAEHRRPARCG
jgi:DNA-binding response OmpR family regulator